MPVANNPNNSLIMLPFKPKALTVALCMVSLGISYSSSAQSVLPHQQDEVIAQNTSPLPAVDFTIPAQSADEAIIAFAIALTFGLGSGIAGNEKASVASFDRSVSPS